MSAYFFINMNQIYVIIAIIKNKKDDKMINKLANLKKNDRIALGIFAFGLIVIFALSLTGYRIDEADLRNDVEFQARMVLGDLKENPNFDTLKVDIKQNIYNDRIIFFSGNVKIDDEDLEFIFSYKKNYLTPYYRAENLVLEKYTSKQDGSNTLENYVSTYFNKYTAYIQNESDMIVKKEFDPSRALNRVSLILVYGLIMYVLYRKRKPKNTEK